MKLSQEAETPHSEPDEIDQFPKGERANMLKAEDLFKETSGLFHPPTLQIRGYKEPELMSVGKIIGKQKHWLSPKTTNNNQKQFLSRLGDNNFTAAQV